MQKRDVYCIYIIENMIYTIYKHMCVCVCDMCREVPPPNGMGLQVAPPFPSICKLLATFLRPSLVFARFLQRF